MRVLATATFPILLGLSSIAMAQATDHEERIRKLEERLRVLEEQQARSGVPLSGAGRLGTSPAVSVEAFERSVFVRHPAEGVYRGQPRLPDFQGRDRDFASYRTRLRNGMAQGVNFAGSLAMVEVGCGTNCRFAFAGDVRNGQVFSFPIGGEDYYSLDLQFRPESRAVVAYWQANQRCMRDVFVWTGKDFSSSGQSDIGPTEACYRQQQ